MTRKYLVTKVPLQKTLADRQSKFGPFKEETDDLFLELIEVQKKLKPGVPLVFIKKPKPPPAPKQEPKKLPKKEKPKEESKKESVEQEKASSHAASEEEAEEKISFEEAGSEESAETESEEGSKAVGSSEESEGSLDSLAESEETPKKKKAKQSSEAVSEEDESVASDVSEKKPPTPVDPYAGMTPEEREREEKKEYLYRWLIIRKKYPGKKFPEFTDHDDLQDMKNAYDRTLVELRVDDSYGKYRTYLIGSFFVIEFIVGYVTDEIRGFCAFQTQAEVMETYDSLLVELGEKTQESWFSKLPVEIRLFGYICFQAMLFLFSKFMARRGGQSLTQLAYTALGIKKMPQVEVQTQTQAQPQPSMKGPSITAEQLRQMQKPKTQ